MMTSGKRLRAFVEAELLKMTNLDHVDGDTASRNWVEDYYLGDVELPQPLEHDVHYYPEIVSKEARLHFRISYKMCRLNGRF